MTDSVKCTFGVLHIPSGYIDGWYVDENDATHVMASHFAALLPESELRVVSSSEVQTGSVLQNGVLRVIDASDAKRFIFSQELISAAKRRGVCTFCGSVFTRRLGAKFCSSDCKIAYHNRIRSK